MFTALLAATMVSGATMDETTAPTVDAGRETVVCIEHAGLDETMWVLVAERYTNGARRTRDLALEPGQKSCLRYDRARTILVNPFYMSDVEQRVADGDRIDPWDAYSCDRIGRNRAVFLQLGSDDEGRMTCEPTIDRDEAAIRHLVRNANPFTGQ